jgi:peroxiredoxin
MRSSIVGVAVVAFASVLASACSKAREPATLDTRTSSATAPAANGAAAPAAAGAEKADKAEVGKPAPDFALKDLDGKEVRLSSFKGTTVVLEWFNPGCPFVKASHTKGSLKDAAKRHTKNGVVWLAVNSAAAGKQGAGPEANREGAKGFAMEHPILLDDTGTVGKTYGATNTPHIMVIDDKGTLVYRGAVDNSPDGEGESAPGNKLVSYVDATLADLAAGRPITTVETKAYGCSVKYGAAH